MERLRFTFTPNGRREFVPRDQDSSSFCFLLQQFYQKYLTAFVSLLIPLVIHVGYEFESILVRFAFLHFFAGRSARGEPTPRLTEVWNFFFFFNI